MGELARGVSGGRSVPIREVFSDLGGLGEGQQAAHHLPRFDQVNQLVEAAADGAVHPAPELGNALNAYFEGLRINRVNPRKEFDRAGQVTSINHASLLKEIPVSERDRSLDQAESSENNYRY